MEIPEKNRFLSILKRHAIAHRMSDVDAIELGVKNDIDYLIRYYCYYPLAIGAAIVITGFGLDFSFLAFCGIPFFLYAIYGIVQVNALKKANGNATRISEGEIRLSRNNVVTVLNAQHILDFKTKSTRLDEEMHQMELLIIDTEKYEHLLLRLVGKDYSSLVDDMQFLKDFIQTKINGG